MENKRIYYLDIAKAIALLLVIFGHTFRESMRDSFLWCSFSYDFVYKFHVSAFFLFSGISYKITRDKYLNKSSVGYIGKKANDILKPWFAYSVLVYIIFCTIQLIPKISEILSNSSYKTISPITYLFNLVCNENPYAFHLWFLYTLFFATVICFLIDKFLKGKKAFALQVALIIILPTVYSLFCDDLVWAIKGLAQKAPFFLLGVVIDKSVVEKRPKIWAALGLLALILLGGFTAVQNDIWNSINSKFLSVVLTYLEYAVVLLISLGILGFCILIETKAKHLERLGKYSMTYYIYHQPFCCAVAGIVLYDVAKLPVIAVIIACMALSIIIPVVIGFLVKKLHLIKIFDVIGLPYKY